MKVLIVNTNENEGGAAKAALRLYNSLISENIDAYYLVDNKISDDYRIVGLVSKIDKLKKVVRQQFDQLLVRRYKNRTGMIFSQNSTVFTSELVDRINDINPDIVHLHWVNNGMLNIKDLLRIKKPIVWTMHDSWLFTGGCHVPYKCEKYKDKCGACPVLGSYRQNDLSYKVFKTKEKIFEKINLTIVTPSKWLQSNCLTSQLLKDKSINVIPNGINMNLYKPIKKEIARELLGLPLDKKIVLFTASSATSDPNKGFVKLSEAISKITFLDVVFVVLGGSKPKNAPNFNHDTYYLGQFHDDMAMVLAYGCADVVVVPSLSENLSNTIMESLSCAIPVVAFNIGGNGDMIEHKINGYLAKPFDASDLKDGIEWILNTTKYNQLCTDAREKVMREFDSKMVAGKHIKLYESILNAM